MKTGLKVLKYTLFITPAIVLLIIIIRLVSSGDPPESRMIMNTYNFETAYHNLGNDFVMYKINVRSPFAINDTFCVVDAFYLESSRDLQLSFRGKKNRFEELRAILNISSENYADLIKLYLRVTTSVITDIPGEVQEETLVTEIFEISARYLFENDRYEYIRVNFSDIKVDYRRTRLELFAFDKLREYDLDDLNNAEFLARITIFDIHMPKERARVERFEILK